MLLDCVLGHELCILNAVMHALYFVLALGYHTVTLFDRRLQLVDVHIEEEALKDLVVYDGLLFLLERLFHLYLLFLQLFDCLLFLGDLLLMLII